MGEHAAQKKRKIIKLASVHGWGGPLTKTDLKNLSKEQIKSIPRSPFNKDVKEGHLYFTGSQADVNKLLKAFRENFAKVGESKSPMTNRRLLDARIERFIRESIRCENSP